MRPGLGSSSTCPGDCFRQMEERRPLHKPDWRSAVRYCLLILCATSLLVGCGDPYEEGMQAFEQEKWAEAVAAFKRVPNLDKRHDAAGAKASEAYFQLGKQAHAQKDWPKTLEYLGHVRRNDDRYEEGRLLMDVARFHLGKAAFEKEDWSAAIELLSLVRKECEHREKARELLAEAQAKKAAAAEGAE